MKTRLLFAAAVVLLGCSSASAQLVNQPIDMCPAPPSAPKVSTERIPFRAVETETLTSGEDIVTPSFFTVPPGKIFTAEHMAADFITDGNHTYYLRLTDAGTFQTYAAFAVDSNLFSGLAAGLHRTLNQPVKIDFLPGQHIILSIQRSKKVGFTSAWVQLTGYLTDAPPECGPRGQ